MHATDSYPFDLVMEKNDWAVNVSEEIKDIDCALHGHSLHIVYTNGDSLSLEFREISSAMNLAKGARSAGAIHGPYSLHAASLRVSFASGGLRDESEGPRNQYQPSFDATIGRSSFNW